MNSHTPHALKHGLLCLLLLASCCTSNLALASAPVPTSPVPGALTPSTSTARAKTPTLPTKLAINATAKPTLTTPTVKPTLLKAQVKTTAKATSKPTHHLPNASQEVSQWLSRKIELPCATPNAPSVTTLSQIALRQGLASKAPWHERLGVIQQHGPSLALAEQEALLQKLFQAYRRAPDSADAFLPYGYAQWIVRGNKTGLFFMRKAADKLPKEPYVQLAYAIAQVDADRHLEGAPPEEYTLRKLDAVHKLDDALAAQRDNPQDKLWPTLLAVRDALASWPAYADWARQDLSLKMVPYGKTLQGGYWGGDLSHVALTDGTSCPVSGPLNDILPGTRLMFERLENPEPLKAPAQVGVVRQYNRDKKHPVRLYKVHGCKFEELSTVQQLFE